MNGIKKAFLATFWVMEACLLISIGYPSAWWLEFVAIPLAIGLIVLFARIIPKGVTAWPTFVLLVATIATSEFAKTNGSDTAFMIEVSTAQVFALSFAAVAFQLAQIDRQQLDLRPYLSRLHVVVFSWAFLGLMELGFSVMLYNPSSAMLQITATATVFFGLGLGVIISWIPQKEVAALPMPAPAK